MVSGRAVLSQSPASGREIQPLDPAPEPAANGRKRPFRARHGLPRSPGLVNGSVASLTRPFKARRRRWQTPDPRARSPQSERLCGSSRLSPKEVSEALKAGRIHAEADGAIDPKRADRDGQHPPILPAARSPRPHESTLSAKPGQKAVSADAVKAASDLLRAAGKRTGDGPMTFTEARTANEIVKAQMRCDPARRAARRVDQ